MIASCSFLPVTVRGNPCADGLLTNFFAPLPRAAAGSYDTVLKVCSVPQFLRPYNWERADISPDGVCGCHPCPAVCVSPARVFLTLTLTQANFCQYVHVLSKQGTVWFHV